MVARTVEHSLHDSVKHNTQKIWNVHGSTRLQTHSFQNIKNKERSACGEETSEPDDEVTSKGQDIFLFFQVSGTFHSEWTRPKGFGGGADSAQ